MTTKRTPVPRYDLAAPLAREVLEAIAARLTIGYDLFGDAWLRGRGFRTSEDPLLHALDHLLRYIDLRYSVQDYHHNPGSDKESPREHLQAALTNLAMELHYRENSTVYSDDNRMLNDPTQAKTTQTNAYTEQVLKSLRLIAGLGGESVDGQAEVSKAPKV